MEKTNKDLETLSWTPSSPETSGTVFFGSLEFFLFSKRRGRSPRHLEKCFCFFFRCFSDHVSSVSLHSPAAVLWASWFSSRSFSVTLLHHILTWLQWSCPSSRASGIISETEMEHCLWGGMCSSSRPKAARASRETFEGWSSCRRCLLDRSSFARSG